MAPQSGKAVPQNVEALPNLATAVTVDWNDKTRTNIQTNNLPFSDIIHAPYVNRILPHIHVVIWNAIPKIH